MVLTTGLELILNACEGVLQIAVTDNEIPLCFQEWFAPGRATELLAPALKSIYNETGISPRNFRRIACFCGPGSFTGIRLVLATAAAMRRSSKACLASLDYLQALATTAAVWRGLPYGQEIYVLTHARRNLLHMRAYISFGPQIPAQPVSELLLLSPKDAREKIASLPCHVCGSGLAENPDIFENPSGDLEPGQARGPVYMSNLVNPGLQALRLLARHGDYFPKDLEPVYARPCDAVENLPDMALKRGENPDQLLDKLDKILHKSPQSEI